MSLLGLHVPGTSFLHRAPAGLKLLGLTTDEIDQAYAERQRMQGRSVLETLAARGAGGA